jgi:multimeric flavodoxin WrbA
MKCLLISASPRKGNSEALLRKIAESVPSELILLKDKEIRHCIGCLACHRKPVCVIDDDMAGILAKMRASDVLVIATPNYFANMSGLAKDLIDRTHPLYKPKALKGKKVILIMVGGSSVEKSQSALKSAIFGFVKYQELDVIGSFCFQDSASIRADEIVSLLKRVSQKQTEKK